MAEPTVAQATPERARQFLEFYYPEIKDLAKHFLTLVSGVLVFSVTFAEKIIDFEVSRAAQDLRWLLAAGWLSLFGAFVLCGLGLLFIFMAADQAKGSLIFAYDLDFISFARRAYYFLDFAGGLFGLGIVLIALAAFFNMNGSHTFPSDSPPPG